MKNLISLGLLSASLALFSGCASYVTPGPGVSLEGIRETDIRERFQAEPAATFPAHIAVVRLQGPGYTSRRNQGFGTGSFTVVTTRDMETEEHWAQLAALPQVAQLAPVSRLILPERLNDLRDLRLAAASMQADMLLVYTLDTSFRVQNKPVDPATVISLGLLRRSESLVTTTASAAIFDVRTGFLYGSAEATAQQARIGSSLFTEETVDALRLETEADAFSRLLQEFEKTWSGVLNRHRPSVSGAQ
jgi:hypothetical protein